MSPICISKKPVSRKNASWRELLEMSEKIKKREIQMPKRKKKERGKRKKEVGRSVEIRLGGNFDAEKVCNGGFFFGVAQRFFVYRLSGCLVGNLVNVVEDLHHSHPRDLRDSYWI